MNFPKLRFLWVIPVLLCFFSFILSILALTAGSTADFMEDYALVTMNTSRIGYSIFNAAQQQQQTSSNPFVSIIQNITDTIEGDIETIVNSIAKELGLHDYYSAHMLDYCEGYYTPSPLPNATLPLSKIHKFTTLCQTTGKVLGFTPSEVLQKDLNNTGLSGISLSTLQWPAELDYNFARMRKGTAAMVGIYASAVAFIGLSLILNIVSVFIVENKYVIYSSFWIEWLAAFFSLMGTSFVTTYATRGYEIINQQGNQIDISAVYGGKIVALTWTATVLIYLSKIWWSVKTWRFWRSTKPKSKSYEDLQKTEMHVLPNKYDGA